MNLLITKLDLIENCGISENTVDKKVNIAIQQAHNKLKRIICRELYAEILTEFENKSLSVKNQNLLEYIIPFLSWQTYSDFIFPASVDHTTAGFREHVGDNEQIVDTQRLNSIKKNAETQVEFWKGELLYYLKKNVDTYPLFKNSGCYDCGSESTSFKITGAGTKDEHILERQFGDSCRYPFRLW